MYTADVSYGTNVLIISEPLKGNLSWISIMIKPEVLLTSKQVPVTHLIFLMGLNYFLYCVNM